MSAQKVRLVAGLIRGKSASQAKDILKYTNKMAAKEVLKTLNSAIANCVHNDNFDKNNLMVSVVCVDEATTYKRGKAVARGRYHQILKRNCHIKIGLTDSTKDNVSNIDNIVEKKETEIKVTAKKTKNLSKKVVKK
jgi:large subunit ribosomal protein L22